MKRYIIRSLKYLLFISLLYVALVWVVALTSYSDMVDGWVLLEAQLRSQQGAWLVATLVVLAAFYPRFGFMRSEVAKCDIVADRVRIDNAMRVHGFEAVGTEGDAIIYRAKGVIKRLGLLYEDRLEVRAVEGGVAIVGIRRAVARVAYQLQAYINNSRFENN